MFNNRINKKKVLIYIIIGGFIFYLLRAILSAIFIPTIPMDSDWCRNGKNVQVSESKTEFICFEFKNDWQETIYYYNLKMISRNRILFFIVLGLAVAATFFIFYFIPLWKNSNIDEKSQLFIYSIGISFFVSFIMTWIYSLILPPPVEWMPEIFGKINDAQIDAAIRELQENCR